MYNFLVVIIFIEVLHFDGWSCQGPGSFLFLLRNNDDFLLITVPLKDANDSRAIYCSSSLIVMFGGSPDISIAAYPYINSAFITNFGHAYLTLPGYPFLRANTRSLLAGDERFIPPDVEVLFRN